LWSGDLTGEIAGFGRVLRTGLGIDKNLYICRLFDKLPVISVSVEVGKYGRIVLPKEIREKYGVSERSRLIIREREGEIVLLPVMNYERPTEALYGSIKLEQSIDEPKRVAKEYLRRKLIEETR